MMNKQNTLAATVSIVMAVISGSPAVAQESAPGASIEEITVTARFREETAQDIGASIAALGNEELTDAGIIDTEDIANRVAGVALLDNGANRNELSIRGVANAVNATGRDNVEPLVSIYIDDISVAAAGAGVTRDINLFDFNRVEVLRGPQPTLFGEGSVGGVVRYFSQDPHLDGDKSVEAVFNTGLSSTESGDLNYRIEGAGSVTLIPDVLGVRFAGSHRDDDGFIDNTLLGIDNANDLESTTGRAVVLYKPTDNLTFRGAVTIARDDVGEFNEISAATIGNSVGEEDLVAPLFNNFDGLQEDDFDLFSGKITWDAGPVTIESITGYYRREISTEILDAGLTVGLPAFFRAVGFTAFANLASYDPTSIRAGRQESKATSQEFRFISDLDGSLNFTAGFFYQDIDTTSTGGVRGAGYADITQPSTTQVTDSLTSINSEQFSGFMELTYEMTEQFRVIAGVRYVNETITNTLVHSSGINLFAPIITGPPPSPVFFTVPDDLASLAAAGLTDPTFEFKLEELLPRFGFEFNYSDNVLFYGNGARGLRNGGQNSILAARGAGAVGTQPFLNALFFDSDQAISGELGVKSEWLEGGMVFNIAGYYTRYKEPQIFVGTPIRAVANAPDQDIYGIEVETSYILNDNISAYFAGTWTSAEYAESGTALPVAGGPPGFLDVAEGNTAQSIPDFSFSLGADVVYPTGWNNANLVGRVDFNYIDKRFTTAQNFPTTEIGSLELLNLRAGIENERWSLVGYVSNLLNDLELTNVLAAPNGAVLVNGVLDTPIATTVTYTNRPRTFGVNLTYRY